MYDEPITAVRFKCRRHAVPSDLLERHINACEYVCVRVCCMALYINEIAAEGIEFHCTECTIAANMNSDIIHHSCIRYVYIVARYGVFLSLQSSVKPMIIIIVIIILFVMYIQWSLQPRNKSEVHAYDSMNNKRENKNVSSFSKLRISFR